MGSGAVGVPSGEVGVDGSGFGLTGSDEEGLAKGLGSMSAGARGTIRSGSVFLKGHPRERCRAWRTELVVAAGSRLEGANRGVRSDCRRDAGVTGVSDRPSLKVHNMSLA